MRKLLFVVLAIPLLLFGIVQAETTNTVLKNIWDSRSDLQAVFPNGLNGINQMKGWTLTKWAEEFGWKENWFLMRYQPGLEMEKAYIYEKYLPLERALMDISTRQYDLENYNCVDFSVDLQKELKEEGITSVLIAGNTQYVGHGYHCWVGVQFDAINGDFVSVLNNYKPVELYDPMR